MLLKNDYVIKAGIIFWAVAVGAYFLQFPFAILSGLIIPSLLLYVVSQLPNIKVIKEKKYIIALSIYVVFMLFLIGRSFFLGIEFSRIMRFSAILFMIPMVCLIKDENFAKKRDIFIIFAVIKSLIIILFGLIIVCQGSFNYLRAWAMNFELGDIYFLNRFIPKVQVRGNALLVIAFFVDYMGSKKLTIRNGIILAGVLVAGNFAFMIALILFAFWQGGIYALKFIRENKYGKIIVIAAGLICVALLVPYVLSKFQEKSAVSNAVRLDQIKILLNSNPFIGDGLGCWVSAATENVNYEGDIYFELQTLYIYKQVGFLALSLYYWITLLPVKKAGKNQLILYLIYLFFSFWNPYCFDTTQMFTILLFINAPNLGEHNEKSASYSLLSI